MMAISSECCSAVGQNVNFLLLCDIKAHRRKSVPEIMDGSALQREGDNV